MGSKPLQEKALSVKEIAARANVSVATVSRVINRKGNVLPKTEARVQEVIAQSNYQPNMIARSLKTSKTPIVGIIVPDISGEFYNTMVQKLQTGLLEKQYATFILNTNKSEDIQKEYREWQSLLHVSGWLVLDSAVDFGTDGSIPTIYINWPDAPAGEKTVTISSDPVLGGRLAGRELLLSGCRNIAVLTSSSPLELRPEGFLQAVKENNDPGVAVMLRYTHTKNVSFSGGYELMADTLRVFPDMDGVFVTADRFVPGVLRALKEAGRSVPKDVKVVGYDDTPIASWLSGGFTTVRQEMDRMCTMAIDAMMRLLEGKPVQEKRTVIPGTLVRRRTTGPLSP